MKHRLKLLAIFLVVALMVPALGSITAQEGTIVDVAAADTDLSTLVAAVQAAGLAETLSGAGPFTVFAPTNEAFATALAAMGVTPADVLADPAALANILSYHVVAESLLAEDVAFSDTLTTVQGQDLSVHVVGDDVFVNNAKVVRADIQASNGVIHVIDSVLFPVLELPAVDPISVTGDIITAGSSTVFPLSSRMSERFEEDGYTGVITVDSIGTGAGFERFCVTAETDIANASRAINDGEREACAANGREAIEFRVGTDALAIVVSSQNTCAQDLTIAQLGAIFAGEFTSWDQVSPDCEALPIKLFSPGTDSGTFDYFVEFVMRPYADGQGIVDDANTQENERNAAAEAFILDAPGAQFSENDNVLVEGVKDDPAAIGYFGYAYFQENADVIRTLSIEGVVPTAQTAETGEYPLSRPLFIYSAANILQEKPQVAAFINYYLSHVDEEILDVGYFPASTLSLNQAKQSWLTATAAQ